MAALQYVDVPGYSALLLRRTYADLSLPGALMDRANDWLRPTDAKWHDKEKVWQFPSGATITFGYLETENTKYRYQGAELQFIGFDELTQFPESQYRYLFSRLRRLKDSAIPLRMRSASNPGGMGHEWVRRRFVDASEHKGVFISAKLDDNPHLDRDEYAQSLNELDPVTRAQLLNGDWEARPAGNKFKREWFAVVDAPPEGLKKVRFWDLAATEPKPGQDPDYTAGVLVGRNGASVYILDVRRDQLAPGEVERLVLGTASQDGMSVPVRIEQEGGASGKIVNMHWARSLVGYDYRGMPASGSKEVRANPLSAAAFNGLVKLVRGPWNEAFLDELECFPSSGVHDDQVDAASGAFAEVTQQRQPRIYVPTDDDEDTETER